jgi:hypothetical protein
LGSGYYLNCDTLGGLERVRVEFVADACAVAAAFLRPVHQQDQGSWLEVALVPGA